MTLSKEGLEAAHAAYAKTTGGMLKGHPMANAITAYLATLPDHIADAGNIPAPVKESPETEHVAGDVLSAPDGLVERLLEQRTVNLADIVGMRALLDEYSVLHHEAATVIRTLQRERDDILGDFSTTAHALESAEQQVRDMLDALNWALGATGEFQPSGVGIGPFWWRAELAARAGLTFDRETCTYRLALKNQESDRG